MSRTLLIQSSKTSRIINQDLRRDRRRLIKVFWVGVGIVALWSFFIVEVSPFESFLSALLIAFSSLLPAFLWCSGRALGMPIFPIFALTHLWTYALPLVTSHPVVVTYSGADHVFASVTVSGTLLLATAFWYRLVKNAPKLPVSLRALDGNKAQSFFMLSLAGNILLAMALNGGWFGIDGGLISVVRGIGLSLGAVATFVLAYRWGKKEISTKQSGLFLVLLIIYTIASASSLLLFGTLIALALAVIGFILGRRKVPWIPIAVAVLFVVILHYGKSNMRAKYWGNDFGGGAAPVQPWDYSDRYTEWFGYSVTNISEAMTVRGDVQPFTERASLIHLLLLAQDKTPKDVSYMYGATYVIIPELFIPRYLHPDKPATLEGVYLLNIHFGLQTREATATTAIGWGLINEAYANFGVFGCAALAVILGLGYGYVARWSMNTPILSARYLFGVLVMGVAFQTELTASVYLTSLFQSAIALFAVTFLLMRVHRMRESSASSISPTIEHGFRQVGHLVSTSLK